MEKQGFGKIVVRGFDDDWRSLVARGAESMGVSLDDSQLDALAFHGTELIKWNKKFNITAITDPHEVALKHFVDALALAPFVPPGANLIDVGSGGGFPGLPLKICRPDVHVVMVDAARKKISFINHVIRMSGLTHAKGIHSRVENLGADIKFSGQFDVVVSRAFTALGRFVSLALPLLSDTGMVIAMKGNLSHEELSDLGRSDFHVEVERYHLPFGDHRRSIVRVRPDF